MGRNAEAYQIEKSQQSEKRCDMNYHNIVHDDMRNGNGLRVTLFVSGCTHNCYNCQNPQTHDFNSGIEFDWTAYNELWYELQNDYIDGITFSGGDPLHPKNFNTVLKLACITKELGKTVWAYTGYTWEQLIQMYPASHFKVFDVIVDGKYVDELNDINHEWAGSTNQRVIDVQKSLFMNEVCLWKK